MVIKISDRKMKLPSINAAVWKLRLELLTGCSKYKFLTDFYNTLQLDPGRNARKRVRSEIRSAVHNVHHLEPPCITTNALALIAPTE